MFGFPSELIFIIASFLSFEDLVRLATVCRQWQFIAERYTMRNIQVWSNRLKDFSDIFAHHHRRAALVDLVYHVVLPTYPNSRYGRAESRQDQDRNNKVVTKAVHELFSILHSWDEEAGMLADTTASSPRRVAGGRMSFMLNAYSPTDLDEEAYRNYRITHKPISQTERYERRCGRSFLQILRCDELPDLPRIQEFLATELYYQRHIEGASLTRVAAKLPNLTAVDWKVNDNQSSKTALRQQHRFDFAQSLTIVPSENLTSVNLTIYNQAPEDQIVDPPSALMDSEPSTDHLSQALHALSLSPNLVHLSLGGNVVLSPCFFWPQEPTATATAPLWPHLQDLQIDLNRTTPDGTWLYVHDPDDNNAVLPTRKLVDGSRLSPMQLAMAYAAKRMPVVKRLGLYLSSAPDKSVNVKFFYGTSEQWVGRQWTAEIGERARWTLPEAVQTTWKKVHGDDTPIQVQYFTSLN
ncbi:hypothetical protein MMC07_008063 [Pseudocyphellaria aurata]|nr:hypothetical protein [Pseudocyphellaria aurata]